MTPFYRDPTYLALFYRHFVPRSADARFELDGKKFWFIKKPHRWLRLLSTPTNLYTANGDQTPEVASIQEAKRLLEKLLSSIFPRKDCGGLKGGYESSVQNHNSPSTPLTLRGGKEEGPSLKLREGDIDAVIFEPVKAGSRAFEYMTAAARELRLPWRVIPALQIPVIADVSLPCGSLHFQKATERKMRKLSRDHGAQFCVLETFEQEKIKSIFATEAKSWKGRSGTALTIDQKAEAFFTDVTQYAAARGNLKIFFLENEKHEVIAFHFCIQSATTLYLIKTGYDEAYHKYSPGIVLTRAVTEWMLDQKNFLKIFSFYGMVMPWHREFTPITVPYVKLIVGARTLRSRVYFVYLDTKIFFKSLLRPGTSIPSAEE